MKAQVKDFAATARANDYTIKYRDRDGKFTVTASLFDSALSQADIKQLKATAFKHNLNLEVSKETDGYTNFHVTEAGSKHATVTNAKVDGTTGRVPGWQWNLIKQTKSVTRSRDRVQEVIDNGEVGGQELDMLEEQLARTEELLVVLLRRIGYYKLNAYL